MARALCSYLRDSGEYTYTLDRQRQDLGLDPTEDFLWNVKQGACERYAGALTLMLRAEGVPARVVKGFYGVEAIGQGHYEVRNSHAHAWVEVLVERLDAEGYPQLHWLTLDPTPGEYSAAATPAALGWLWLSGERLSKVLWQSLIVDYDAEEQTALFNDLQKAAGQVRESTAGNGPIHQRGPVVLLFGLVLAVLLPVIIWLTRRARRGRPLAGKPVRAPAVRFYARLLRLLARHCDLRPTLAQTAREFTEAAARRLALIPAAASLADVPGEAATLFYRVRFGGEPLNSDESQAIDHRLDQLAAALYLSRNQESDPLTPDSIPRRPR
jgi:hypothetical protein